MERRWSEGGGNNDTRPLRSHAARAPPGQALGSRQLSLAPAPSEAVCGSACSPQTPSSARLWREQPQPFAGCKRSHHCPRAVYLLAISSRLRQILRRVKTRLGSWLMATDSAATHRLLKTPGAGRLPYMGWDDHAVHGNIFEIMKRRAPQFDQAVSALIDDLIARGLDRKVLVVVVGEFGRTPRISYKDGNPGRETTGELLAALWSLAVASAWDRSSAARITAVNTRWIDPFGHKISSRRSINLWV